MLVIIHTQLQIRNKDTLERDTYDVRALKLTGYDQREVEVKH